MVYQRKRKSNKTKRRIKSFIISLSFIVLIFISVTSVLALWHVNDFFDEIIVEESIDPNGNKQEENNKAEAAMEPANKDDSSASTSLLLLGYDTRPETGSLNTDVIMVAVLNHKTKQVSLLSIPRDIQVEIPKYGLVKANAVFNYGEKMRRAAEKEGEPITETGPALAKEVFGELLGIPIQHFVTVDFQAFTAIVDKLGGIRVDVDKTLIYDDPSDNTHIYLKAGEQVLDGREALGYVRHRLDNRGPGFYSSDFDRNRRQQQVIKASIDKLQSWSGVTKIFGLLEVAGKHIRTDLSKEQIKNIVFDFSGIDSKQIYTIENKAYWDSSAGATIIPAEQLSVIKQTLQSEMQIQ